MTVSPNRDPRWTEDLQALLFGIHEPRRRDGADERRRRRRRRAGDARATATSRGAPAADEKVDLVLWHWQDSRLQTQQEVQEARDRTFSYLAEYRVEPKKFIRLADEDVRTVTVAPKERWAIGIDDREYELMGNLDGRRFQDVYAIDLTTGERKLAGKRLRWFNGAVARRRVVPLLRGRRLPRLFAGDRAGARTSRRACRCPSSTPKTITTSSSRRPASIGWASDSKSVLLHDNWDVWQVPCRRRRRPST